MAFELEKLITDIINSKTLNNIFNNPIYSAIITVSVVLLLIYLTMRNDVTLVEDSNTSMMALILTAGIYCVLAVLGLVYLQHRAMSKDFEQKHSNRANDALVEGITGQGEVATLDVFNQKPVLQDINADESLLAEESQSEESPKPAKKSSKYLSVVSEMSTSSAHEKIGDDLTDESSSHKNMKKSYGRKKHD